MSDTPARRRGRPPIADHQPTTSICVRVSPTAYDRAFARATQQHLTVPELLRRGLARVLDDDDDERD